MDGEIIDLCWEWECPAYYVRGHITPEAVLVALRAEYGEGVDQGLGTPRPRYGRWAQTGTSRQEGWSAELRIYDAPGRGRFKLMEAVRETG